MCILKGNIVIEEIERLLNRTMEEIKVDKFEILECKTNYEISEKGWKVTMIMTSNFSNFKVETELKTEAILTFGENLIKRTTQDLLKYYFMGVVNE
jgi:hypothetical protein